jgi:hypothetical protein
MHRRVRSRSRKPRSDAAHSTDGSGHNVCENKPTTVAAAWCARALRDVHDPSRARPQSHGSIVRTEL